MIFASAASAFSAERRPLATASPRRLAIPALPRSAAAASTSTNTTSTPARAATCAIPAPINPDPRIPIFRNSVGGGAVGRRYNFSHRVLLMNNVRIMFRVVPSIMSRVMYLHSTRSARSIGNSGPSKRHDKIACGAGKLSAVFSCTIALVATKRPATRGSIGPAPPGIRKSRLSHGFTQSPTSRTQRLAASSNSPTGTTASITFADKAAFGSSALPSSNKGIAACMPSMRERRWVPPPAGSMPI